VIYAPTVCSFVARTFCSKYSGYPFYTEGTLDLQITAFEDFSLFNQSRFSPNFGQWAAILSPPAAKY
jgi:hypothetical protein